METQVTPETQREAFEIIHAIQKTIYKSANGGFTGFRFEISIDKDGVVCLGPPRGFSMCDAQTKRVSKFKGDSVEVAVREFIGFFIGGNRIKFSIDENDNQVCIEVGYSAVHGWEANVRIQHYEYKH